MPNSEKLFIMKLSAQFKTKNKYYYLDSAATTQTPTVVLDTMNEYYEKYRANVHRGVYDMSVKATEKYEAARSDVAEFINAQPEEIIFTSGTTQSLNQLAYSIGPRLSHRDNIVLTRMEHHANLVPWQQMAKHYGFEIRFIEFADQQPVISNPPTQGVRNLAHDQLDPSSFATANSLGMTGEINLDSVRNVIDENTKIISLTYVSNVLGTINPVAEIIKIARQKSPKAYTIVDAAQAMAHIPVDVRALDCDFLAFSGHKMYGPTGIGVLYGKKILLEEHLEPFFFGGEMVKSVSYEKSEWNDVPLRFEAGTPNIAGAIGLGAAVKFIQGMGWEKIQEHEQTLANKLIDQLARVGVYPICHFESSFVEDEKSSLQMATLDSSSFAAANSLGMTNKQIGIVSFTIPGIHPHDIAEILGQEGVCVRAGFHCAEPLHRYLGLHQGTVRVSLGMYNTEEDIRKLIQGIEKVKKIFTK